MTDDTRRPLSAAPTPQSNGAESPLTRLMGSLAQKRDAGTLTAADVEAANAELVGIAARFELDGRGGFAVALTGMVPDMQSMRKPRPS